MHKARLELIVFIERHERRIIALLLAALTLFGIAYAYYLGNSLRYPDEREYDTLAMNLVHRQIYSIDGQMPTAFRAPGYPFILAALSLINPSIIFLRIANFIILSLSAYLLYRILRTHSTALAAVIGAVLVCAYPVLFYTAGTLYPQTAGACLLLGTFYLISKNPQSFGTSILLGLLFGSMILLIPTCIIVPIICLLWMFITKQVGIRQAAIITLVTLLTLTPWTLRNYQAFHTFVFISSNSGLNLLLGNSENTTPNSGTTVDITKYDAVAGNLNEIDRDMYYKSQAITFIQNNPVYSLKLYVLKLLNHFNYRNDLRTSAESSNLSNLVVLFSYGFLVLVTLLRIALYKYYRISNLEWLILLLYSANALVTAIFFTRIRFRLPFDMLLIVVVALFLAQVLQSKVAGRAIDRTLSQPV